MALTEQRIPDDRIEILNDGSLQIREATVLLRDGVVDTSFPPKYHRYVLHPGDDLTDKGDRIVSVANSVWTPEVIAAFAANASANED
jgi:hypothetical protein